MSEFINRTKIATLEQSNSELLNEISNLETDLNDLIIQLEHHKRETPDKVEYLKKKITEHEQREAEFKENISSISKEKKNASHKYEVVEQLLSSLEMTDSAIVETAIAQYHKKKATPQIIIAFLLGVFASLVAWLIIDYLEKDKSYREIIKRVIDTVSN
jgi:DNA repair exonuclease SbcCD ATPase subunit